MTSGWKYTGKKLLSSGLYFIAAKRSASLLTFVLYSQKPYKKYRREVTKLRTPRNNHRSIDLKAVFVINTKVGGS